VSGVTEEPALISCAEEHSSGDPAGTSPGLAQLTCANAQAPNGKRAFLGSYIGIWEGRTLCRRHR
jgi:hypothetical protein